MLGEVLVASCDYRMGDAATLEREGELWNLRGLGIAVPAIVPATGAKLRRLGVPA
jgi:hypothetical protein